MELRNWGEWTDWEPLHSADLSRVPHGPGAYMIAAGQAIHRAFGVDEEGILDIGESGHLRQRVQAFIGCALGRRKAGHMAGWRFHRFNFEARFPFQSLYLSWHGAAEKDGAYLLEARILDHYLMQHSELPPLNYKYNWSRFEG